jgi:hypothetical protein
MSFLHERNGANFRDRNGVNRAESQLVLQQFTKRGIARNREFGRRYFLPAAGS